MSDQAFTELIPLTPSRKRLREGDVFLLQPIPGTFYCGQIIRLKVESRDSFVNGMSLIYIYDRRVPDRGVPAYLDAAPLLIQPVVINRLPWSRGYFETVGNLPVTERERRLSFGFWDTVRKRFVDAGGNPLAKEPLYWTDYGLASYAVVGMLVQRALAAREFLTEKKEP